MDNLGAKFQKELYEKVCIAKRECIYNATRFNQMLSEYGGVETAKRLIAAARKTGNPSDGFTTLLLSQRLDLTMEDSVCKPEYRSLFTEEEIGYCLEVLGRK